MQYPFVPPLFLSHSFQFSGHFDADFVRLAIDIYDGIHNIDHLVEDFLNHWVTEGILRQRERRSEYSLVSSSSLVSERFE